MLTLGIETSCDETGASIVDNGKVLSNIVSSSVRLHARYGGVVPEIASRCHIEYLNGVTRQALEKAGKRWADIRLIAVTFGPGLAGSLLSGIAFAKALAFGLNRPLIGVNHLPAHLYANFLNKTKRTCPAFPCIGLVVSGGHTSLYLFHDITRLEVIGRTRDDA
ncbi:MAG: tRNA (adenosine(37)-N6)-threonylcarbamoyltransferase complex transferase subunit TsaD, partial [Candidatus Omnitrophica bacterium]|nr:tRNA (adenosine(37)-N6)-threonylcarbamoyltransferase complex transferase subunit TsaD [Candidatus Omnitrophota bacterium]